MQQNKSPWVADIIIENIPLKRLWVYIGVSNYNPVDKGTIIKIPDRNATEIPHQKLQVFLVSKKNVQLQKWSHTFSIILYC